MVSGLAVAIRGRYLSGERRLAELALAIEAARPGAARFASLVFRP
jgi:hypothetical protein